MNSESTDVRLGLTSASNASSALTNHALFDDYICLMKWTHEIIERELRSVCESIGRMPSNLTLVSLGKGPLSGAIQKNGGFVFWSDIVGYNRTQRSTVIHGKIAKVSLQGNLEAIIDSEDARRVSKYTWTAHRKPDGNTYAVTQINGRQVKLHRFVLDLGPEDKEVDHKNRDGLDNRKENLRLATTAQNQWNQKKKPRGSSKFKGVTYVERNPFRPWMARMTLHNRKFLVGFFETDIEAAMAYDGAVIQARGDFGSTNKGLGLL